MTKSTYSIVTTGITYLNIVTFLIIVTESTFTVLPLGRYLLPITTMNRYLSWHISKNFIFIISSENIAINQTWGIPGNHSNFVLCHNSLNLVNLGKII